MRRLSLSVNLIQHQHEFALVLNGPRCQALLKQDRKTTDVLASSLAGCLPFFLLPQSLQCVPYNLCQEMPSCNAFRAPDNGVWHFEGSEDGLEDSRFAGCRDTVDDQC